MADASKNPFAKYAPSATEAPTTPGIKLPPGAKLTKSPGEPSLPPGATLTKSPAAAASAPSTSDAANPFAKYKSSAASEGAPAPPRPPVSKGFDILAQGQGRIKSPTFDEFMQGAEAWARGTSYETSDDASAWLAAAILKAKGDPRSMHDLYTQLDQAENDRIDAYEKEHGKAAEIAGMFTGPGFIRLGRWIGQGANLLQRGARAALGGAGSAAVADIGSAAPGDKIDPKRTGKAAAIGAAVGPVLQGATEVVAPQISRAAQMLIDQGVRPTIGQLMGGAAKARRRRPPQFR
jgi:hypothetical protein